MGEGTQGHLFAGTGLDVETAERVRALAEFGRHFQDHVVLVDLRKHDGDEALSKGVVQRVVDGCCSYAKPRSGIAIHDQIFFQSVILLIGGDVAQIRQRLEPFHEPGDPGGQIIRVGGFQAVLILRATDAIFHSQVLHSLHEQLNPFNGLHFVGEPTNDCRDIVRALIARLDVDLNAPAIRRHVRAVDADERGEAHHLGILQDHARELPLLLGHAFEGSGLRSLRNTQDHSGILHREKALGHDHVHI